MPRELRIRTLCFFFLGVPLLVEGLGAEDLERDL